MSSGVASGIAAVQAQGPSTTCAESKEEEEDVASGIAAMPREYGMKMATSSYGEVFEDGEDGPSEDGGLRETVSDGSPMTGCETGWEHVSRPNPASRENTSSADAPRVAEVTHTHTQTLSHTHTRTHTHTHTHTHIYIHTHTHIYIHTHTHTHTNIHTYTHTHIHTYTHTHTRRGRARPGCGPLPV